MTSSCVLLIEDDPHACKRLELLIEAIGLRVYSVSAAQEARGALAAVRFPIVIIDRMLGDEEGIALCQQLASSAIRWAPI
jgi:DNA-binding response OmpR family regulator